MIMRQTIAGPEEHHLESRCLKWENSFVQIVKAKIFKKG